MGISSEDVGLRIVIFALGSVSDRDVMETILVAGDSWHGDVG